ncbi:MAG: hypothetical protein JSS43_07165, partial [Proteobacteria bacterium]|nr:hypothetical protein [Pseudomonadota bacterium]
RGGGWLDAAEDAGRAALEDDLSPDVLAARIPPPPELDTEPDIGRPLCAPASATAALWWTEGAPLVPAQMARLHGLPDPAIFIAMLEGGIVARPDA